MRENICLCLSASSLYSTWSPFPSYSCNYLNFLLLYGWIQFNFSNSNMDYRTGCMPCTAVHLHFHILHKTFSGQMLIVATSMGSLRIHATLLPGNHLPLSKVLSLLVCAEAVCTSMPPLSTRCHSGACSSSSLAWKTALNSYMQHQRTRTVVGFCLLGTSQPQVLSNSWIPSGVSTSPLLPSFTEPTFPQIVRIWNRIREKILKD